MADKLEKLVKENIRLSNLAQLDGLTGVYNRATAQEKINHLLEQNQEGILIVMDADKFKQINDHYGHLKGDFVLQKIAKTLKKVFRSDDLVARVGGDEFIVFLNELNNIELVDKRMEVVNKQLGKGDCPVHVSYGYSCHCEGDDYTTIFERADKKLLEVKAKNSAEIRNQGINTEKDIAIIQQNLREQGVIQGAYCQTYEIFKGIYRFVERSLNRTHQMSHIILLTLEGKFSLLEQNQYMEQLFDVIRDNIRMGDVYTQYSSCQYIVMVVGASHEDTKKVASRIHECFMEISAQKADVLCLEEMIYPLKSIHN